MPHLQVDLQAVESAGRAVTAQDQAVGDVADALGSVFREVAATLPGSRTAGVTDEAAVAVPAAVRALAFELASLAGALGVAAAEYAAVERQVATALGRAGRRPE